MEYDQNLIFNFASIIATALFVSAAGITIFRRLKLRWPIDVNCWFCNNDTKVYNSQLNWWMCPTCEQYNGFTKDGDYAYDIPEQSTQVAKSFVKPYRKFGKSDRRSAGLCERCNHNEELKIFELRNFEPKGFFNTGLEQFKKELELKFPLCDDCKILVQNVLHKQSLWLTRYKMLFFKQKSVNVIIDNAKKVDKVIRVFLTMLTSILICYPNYWSLPFIGAFLQSIALITNQAPRISDLIITLLWICIGLIGPLNELNLFQFYPTNEWPSLESITQYHFVTLLTLIIGLTNITSRYGNTRSFVATFKKLESPSGKKTLPSILDDSIEDFGTNSEINEPATYSNYHQPPIDLETSLRKFSSRNDSSFIKSEDRQIASSFVNDISRRDSPTPVYMDTGRRHILKFDGNYEQYSLNESLSTLKTLTLGESRSGNSTRIPNIFKTKVYGSTSPDLFQRSRKSSKKFILAPPKLKSVTQSSWVAGGYWQVGVDSPTLSRSSSQSSGFGSAGSNFGPSREPSVTKEFDKCSVVSDNTQFCYAPRTNSPNSINSCCPHAAPVQFARCENSIYNQPLKIIPNSLFVQNSQSHFSPVHPESNVCYERCFPLQNSNVNSSVMGQNQPISNCNVPCPNLMHSHVWLPILLCGSLVFNIAVFCIILLR